MKLCSLALILACLGSSPAHAADGVLIIDHDDHDSPTSIVVSPNGRIYVAAFSYHISPTGTTDHGAVTLAFDSSGVPIASFGDNGKLVNAHNPGLAQALADDSFINGLLVHTDAAGSLHRAVNTGLLASTGAIQPDGKYVAFGYFRNGLAPPVRWSILRFNPDGLADTSFAGGVVERSGSPSSTWYRQVLVLPDGKILAGGYSGGSSNLELMAWLIESDGVPVASFGSNGIAFQPRCNCTVRSDNKYMFGHVAFDPISSKIYLSGTNRLVSRLDMTGAVDASFPVLPLAQTTSIAAMHVDSQGRLLLFGSTYDGDASDGYVSRYLPTGTLDASFGSAGTAIVHVGDPAQYNRIEGAQILADGKLLVLLTVTAAVNGSPSISGGYTDAAVVRLHENGALDSSFVATTPAPDTVPDGFPFASVTVPYGTANVTSAPVAVVGINQAAEIRIVGASGSFSVGCTGTYQTASAQISRGQTVCARGAAPTGPSASSTVTVSIGGRESVFTINSSATAVDVTPDAISFTAQSSVNNSASITSNTVTISGINGPAALSIEGGEYSVGCVPGSFVSTGGFIDNGQTICVRHTSASSAGATTTTRLHVGTLVSEFSSTTAAAKKKKSGGGRSSLLEILAMLALVAWRFGRARRSSPTARSPGPACTFARAAACPRRFSSNLPRAGAAVLR